MPYIKKKEKYYKNPYRSIQIHTNPISIQSLRLQTPPFPGALAALQQRQTALDSDPGHAKWSDGINRHPKSWLQKRENWN